MRSPATQFVSEAVAVFAKDWRCELRTRAALNAVALFAVSTLFVVGLGLGPLGVSSSERLAVLPALLWVVLLFAASAGLPRAFAHEEEVHTATALRLAGRPGPLFCGKLLFEITLLAAIEILVVPIFIAMVQLPVEEPVRLLAVLVAGGYGLAAGSTLVAAIVSQARGKGTLFAVLAVPVLVPLLLLAIELTRAAVGGVPAEGVLRQLLLYDASVTVAGMMLFPAVWNP
ncbi:MAG: heme exporter protein CcmB [Acidobacteriota bacterium]